ncbi:unnamed protein product [Diatraea saccharalis]|uniref:Alpha-mannosidase n=1 Tax=Diatraea saccharalis TaxID=40085 RepID=A0A9P0C5B3_9NEOP|nr:unnamed protein product [Diatraea saccharalis]
MAKVYLTNNILVTMGDDFNYQDAGMWFKNLDKLIKYGNEKAIDEKLNINIFYSTPDCYLKAVKDANPTLPVKQDDFFPYASDPHSYWTGYFTSRPTIKFIEAEANRYMQIVKQLYVLADLPADDMPVLDKLKSAMGVLQHHDAITGTEKQHVTYDYIRLISEALHDAHETITTKVLNEMIHGKAANVQWTFERCQLNESSCVTSENLQGNMIVTLYNPLAWSVRTPVNIPVSNSEEYEMKDSNGIVYPVQTSPIPDGFKRISTRKSKATHQITFVAPVPALGYKSYYIQKSRQRRDKRDVDSLDGAMRYNTFGYDEVMSDDPMVVQRYDEVADEAILSTIDKKDERISGHTLSYNPAYYPACIGNNMIYANRSSGAYIFRPNATNATPLKTLTDTQITGHIFEEHRSIMSDNFEFYNRVYKDANNLTYNELYWLIGPIVDTDGVGKEYVMKYTADLVTNGEFMTDSNGRTLLKRKLNERPQWNLTLEEPVAGNYYPVVGVAIVENAAKDGSLRIVPDRPEGGASLQEGQIEIMLHRRLLHDDAFGVGEALNETVNGVGLVVTGYQRVFGVNNDKFSFKDVLEMRSKPDVFVTDAEDISYEQFKSLNTEKSWLKDGLEVGVHLLTLEPLSGDRFLIRFENYLDKSSDSTKNIDLDKVIKGFKLRSVDETVLSGDKLLKDYNRWVWRTNKEFAKDFNEDYGSFAETPRAVDRVKEVDDGNKIKLDAKEIRTFIVQYELE